MRFVVFMDYNAPPSRCTRAATLQKEYAVRSFSSLEPRWVAEFGGVGLLCWGWGVGWFWASWGGVGGGGVIRDRW